MMIGMGSGPFPLYVNKVDISLPRVEPEMGISREPIDEVLAELLDTGRIQSSS